MAEAPDRQAAELPQKVRRQQQKPYGWLATQKLSQQPGVEVADTAPTVLAEYRIPDDVDRNRQYHQTNEQ